MNKCMDRANLRRFLPTQSSETGIHHLISIIKIWTGNRAGVMDTSANENSSLNYRSELQLLVTHAITSSSTPLSGRRTGWGSISHHLLASPIDCDWKWCSIPINYDWLVYSHGVNSSPSSRYLSVSLALNQRRRWMNWDWLSVGKTVATSSRIRMHV